MSLFLPLIRNLSKASNIEVPPEIVIGLVKRGYQPRNINQIMWHYSIWQYLLDREGCVSCGADLNLGTRSTTKTCSPRCHKIATRHDEPPFELLKTEATERLSQIKKMTKGRQVADPASFQWYQLNNGWKYALHIEQDCVDQE